MNNLPFDFTAFSNPKEFVSFVFDTERAFNHYFNQLIKAMPELAILEIDDIFEMIKAPIIEMAVKDWYDHLTSW